MGAQSSGNNMSLAPQLLSADEAETHHVSVQGGNEMLHDRGVGVVGS